MIGEEWRRSVFVDSRTILLRMTRKYVAHRKPARMLAAPKRMLLTRFLSEISSLSMIKEIQRRALADVSFLTRFQRVSPNAQFLHVTWDGT